MRAGKASSDRRRMIMIAVSPRRLDDDRREDLRRDINLGASLKASPPVAAGTERR